MSLSPFSFFFSVCCLLFLGACNLATDTNHEEQQNIADQSILPVYTFTQVVTNAELASPRKQVIGNTGEIPVLIDYGSPSVKGRDVWGGLVPYDEVWRAGANEATIFKIEEDALIEGELLEKGSYSLFTIPSKSEWTVIFNKTYEQWGSYEYNEKEDALRINVKPVKEEKKSETLEFTIAEGEIALWWEFLKIPIQVTDEISSN